MSAINPGVYKAILRVREAYVFDIGCFLMRFLPYMNTIGTVTMLTLSGFSFFVAGLVSSTIALATFFISPRVSKLVDTYGQSKVVSWAAALTLLGVLGMALIVLLDGPDWLLFVAAVFMGFSPNPPALARTRWTFLIRSGRLGKAAPIMRTMFSYEGVLDDVGFMFSPSISVALASAITPVAGMVFGAVAFAAGAVLLMCSRGTEPTPGWDEVPNRENSAAGETAAARYPACGEGGAACAVESAASEFGGEGEAGPAAGVAAGADAAVLGEAPGAGGGAAGGASTSAVSDVQASASPDAAASAEDFAHRKSVFRTSSVVRVLFVLMLFVGAFYGVFDTSTVSFAEEVGDTTFASVVLMASAVTSMLMGFVFGMIRLRMPQYRQLVLFAALIGLAYGTMMLIDSKLSLFLVGTLAAFAYAPFLIVANGTCERSVPGDRLTEAITWMNAGVTCGMAFGPTISGTIIDTLGAEISFDFGALLALAIPVTALLCFRIIKRDVKQESDLNVVHSSRDGI